MVSAHDGRTQTAGVRPTPRLAFDVFFQFHKSNLLRRSPSRRWRHNLNVSPMKRLFLLCMLVALSSPQFLFSQEADEEPDYRKLRYEFAGKKGYKPYAIQAIEQANIADAMEHWTNNAEARAFEVFEEVLEIYPWSIETHRRMADGFEIILEGELSEEQRKLFTRLEAKHRRIYKGLVGSILKDSDGKTPETAFKVITLPEQAWVLHELGIQPKSRSSNVEKGLDIYVVDGEDGEEFNVYFDVSILVETLKEEPPSEPTESKSKERGD